MKTMKKCFGTLKSQGTWSEKAIAFVIFPLFFVVGVSESCQKLKYYYFEKSEVSSLKKSENDIDFLRCNL